MLHRLIPLLMLCALGAQANVSASISQVREPGESFETALTRHLQQTDPRTISVLSAQSVAGPWSKVDVSAVPEWSPDELKAGFEQMRDSRFLNPPDMPDFSRRSSWLYPDDGCFARAALGGQNLQKWGFKRPLKLFIFGSLAVRTANSPSGWVSWWYHTVPVVQVDGQVMILDPAIEPQGALPFESWVKRMGGTSADFLFSVCRPRTYDPYTSCTSPDADAESPALDHQYAFLDLEWSRLEDLGRNPTRELGTSPPWVVGHGFQ
jgi:hypothetical protein